MVCDPPNPLIACLLSLSGPSKSLILSEMHPDARSSTPMYCSMLSVSNRATFLCIQFMWMSTGSVAALHSISVLARLAMIATCSGFIHFFCGDPCFIFLIILLLLFGLLSCVGNMFWILWWLWVFYPWEFSSICTFLIVLILVGTWVHSSLRCSHSGRWPL